MFVIIKYALDILVTFGKILNNEILRYLNSGNTV